MKQYLVRRTAAPPAAGNAWTDRVWQGTETLEVGEFHPEGSAHRPRTQARLLHDGKELHGMFRVEDRFVRCLRTEPQSHVCADSCVEFFVWPRETNGYINFEFNCGGTVLSKYFADPFMENERRHREAVPVEPELLARIGIWHSMPKTVDPEIEGPVEWTLQFHIPLEVLERHLGDLKPLSGSHWRANFFKCGDETSHPHWASWNPIGEELNFHQPLRFGTIEFE